MRKRWVLQFLVLSCLVAPLAFGQGANGTITGTITDPTKLVVAGASVEARNTDTGAVYNAASTGAGNYALPNLPVGTYVVTVRVPGFKTYTHANLALAAAQVLREDITLEVGAPSESVTVEAQASLLKTETGEQSDNITLEQMQDLPMLGIGTVNSGTSGVRNPYNVLQTLPGVTGYTVGQPMAINGLGGAQGFSVPLSETMRIEGQDATSQIFGNYVYTQMAQPNADAIQEVAVQTSNYAAEFGQAGTAVINMTMKSGTNQYHGTAFDYFVNEDLNAGDPFSVSDSGGKMRPVNRRNDFGGTLGGPVVIPKLYNGHDKTFFFFAYEEYLENNLYTFTDTVPTAAYRNGDFSAISTNGNCSLCAAYGIQPGSLGNDALGRPMYANEIYDPTSRGVTSGGLGYANPFTNNVIPASMFSASSKAFQALFPLPTNGNLVGNYAGAINGNRYTAIPSIKIDQVISSKDKLSFYWSRINTESQIASPYGNADGLPTEIGGYRGTFIPSYTTRLNYDRTLTPTMLLHVGVGYYHTSFSDRAPFLNFDPSQFGLTGFVQHRQFPSITGMCVPPPGFPPPVGCGGYGGMQTVGTSGQIQSQNYEEKPSANVNATWVHGNHTYKLGAELYLEQVYTGNFSGVTLQVANSFTNTPAATAQPFIPQFSLNGYNQGFNYASFLLGDYNSTTQSPAEFTRTGQQVWGLFIQDSWKATRKLTINYGLRWDYSTPQREQYGRWGQFDPTVPNANAGGLLGGTRYASNCHCNFYMPAYPYALGPRLSVAYQLTPKTVFRGGWGINYNFVGSPAGQTIGTNGVYPLAGINPYVNIATPGSIVQPAWPVTDPSVFPPAGTVGSPGFGFGPPTDPFVADRNENRPPRINQWSIGFQQEITPNFILEANYVGNRAVWLQSPGGPLGFLSQISPQRYAAYHLYPYPGTGPCSSGTGVCKSSTYDNYSDFLLTTQPIFSSQVIGTMASRGITNLSPYPGFPFFNSLGSAILPYPQFGAIEPSNSPTGDSKYDSLQIKATKRLSHGLQISGNFTWAQGFNRPTPQDFFNSNGTRWVLQQIPPQNFNLTAIYTVPKFSVLPKVANGVLHDWQIGWYSNYQSGAFLPPPVSPTLNFLPSEDIRVPGQPLYTSGVNLNDQSTYAADYTQVLNPKAWAPCPANAVCGAAAAGPFGNTATVLYKDFRAPRIPTENASIGRNFRFQHGDHVYNLYIRGEFVNVFNRTLMPPPDTTSNPQNPVIRAGANGPLLAGFGVIPAYNTPGTITSQTPPFLLGRTGTIIARFSF